MAGINFHTYDIRVILIFWSRPAAGTLSRQNDFPTEILAHNCESFVIRIFSQ